MPEWREWEEEGAEPRAPGPLPPGVKRWFSLAAPPRPPAPVGGGGVGGYHTRTKIKITAGHALAIFCAFFQNIMYTMYSTRQKKCP